MGTNSPKRIAEPWSMLELNRIVMAARTMPDFVGDIAGLHWWPALILLILDLDISAEVALTIPATALNSATGRISIRHALYQLHAVTFEAFTALPADREMLLPWLKDSGKPPFYMLYRDWKTVLFRAGLPYTRLNSFVRLQVTSRRQPDVMAHIRPIQGFVCNEGKPHLIRARELRRHALPKNVQKNAEKDVADELTETGSPKHQHRKGWNSISANPVPLSDDPKTLLNIFRSKYRPVRLRQASQTTVADYERCIALVYSFAGLFTGCIGVSSVRFPALELWQ